jgi:hypothetical protein
VKLALTLQSLPLFWWMQMTNAYLDSFSLGPIQVVDEHFDAVLLNCYDAIGIMLIIRIIHQHQVFLSFPL